jgi:hypothetical protein
MRHQQGQHQGRQRRHQENPVTAPPTQKSINKETRAATNTRYRPLERAEGAELRASRQREKQVGNWWKNYQDIVAQGRAETQAAYGQAAAQGQAFIDQASARDSANTARLQSEANQSAALRGAEPSSEAANREAAAQGQRNYLAANTGARIANQGANQFAYLTNEKRIGAGQSISSRREEQRRQRSVEADRKKTRDERGEYATVKRGELHKEARDYLIQRRATAIEGREAKLKGRQAAEEARENAEENRRKNEHQQNENTETKRNGKNGGLTPSEQRTIRKEHREQHQANRQAYLRAKEFIKAHGLPKGPEAHSELIEKVEEGDGVGAKEARRAVNRIIAEEKKRIANSPGTKAWEHRHEGL